MSFWRAFFLFLRGGSTVSGADDKKDEQKEEKDESTSVFQGRLTEPLYDEDGQVQGCYRTPPTPSNS